jgi:hypothetical protein
MLGGRTQKAIDDLLEALYRYLMVKTIAAHLSVRQQKFMLANRPSPGQPITTNNKQLGSV